MTTSGQNPYLPPNANLDAAAGTSAAGLGVACPKCGEHMATKVSYNWWGGALGPRLFNVVKCTKCRMQYNGKTGGKLTKVIIVYQAVAIVVVGGLAYLWLSSR